MDYTEKDFAKCVFNPMTKGKMARLYPKLDEIMDGEDRMQPHIDKLLRYIIALYDSDSPLVYQEKELKFRKEVAAEIAGFKEDDSELLLKIFQSKDERANKLTIAFLKKFIKNRVWAMIVSSEAAFWSSTERLMQQGEEKVDSLKQIEVQDRTHERLEKLYKDFYGDDTDLLKADKKTQRLTPEMIASNGK